MSPKLLPLDSPAENLQDLLFAPGAPTIQSSSRT